MKQNGVIIGMPAYNEARYIGSVILKAKNHARKVVVVDDGSTDATSDIAQLAGAAVIRHDCNQGYGRAIQVLLSEAKRQKANILVILDADSQHNPDEIPLLIDGIRRGADIAIGSRNMRENSIAGYRRLGQRLLSYMTSIASRKRLNDTESGFRAYSRKAIHSLNPKEPGMAVSSEIVTEAAAGGLKIVEIPISVSYTRDGSTFNPVKHGMSVLNRILAMISERRPLLFFSLLGGLSLAIGITAGFAVVWMFYFSTNNLAVGLAMVSILFVTIGMLTIFTGLILNVLTKRLSH